MAGSVRPFAAGVLQVSDTWRCDTRFCRDPVRTGLPVMAGLDPASFARTIGRPLRCVPIVRAEMAGSGPAMTAGCAPCANRIRTLGFCDRRLA